MKLNQTVILSVTFLLTSCSLMPAYQRPAVDVPLAWSQGAKVSPVTQNAFEWWKSFGSDELNKIMAEGLNNNLDLKASKQRVAQARASIMVSRASIYPNVNSNNAISRNDKIKGPSPSNDHDVNLDAGMDISYEVDLFGKNKSGIEAAKQKSSSAQFQYDALAIVVISDIAKDYFNILSANERLKILDQNLKNANDLLKIIDARHNEGAASGLELAQQKTILANFEASRAATEKELEVYKNALAVLLGKAPQTLGIEANDLKDVQVPVVAIGQPADLIIRRPDIASAEADLKAADADIGAARAAFFPSVTLGSGISFVASPISAPVTAGISTTASLLVPIFKGGILKGALLASEARKAELVEIYRKTILTSLQEVEDALAGEKSASQRESSFKSALDSSQKVYDLTQLRYKAGGIDFQTVIDSQDSLLQAQESYVNAKNERISNAIDLFKALGGSWR